MPRPAGTSIKVCSPCTSVHFHHEPVFLNAVVLKHPVIIASSRSARVLGPSHCAVEPCLIEPKRQTPPPSICRPFKPRESENPEDLLYQGKNQILKEGRTKKQTRKMGSEGEYVRKPRFLCLHGFRTSGEILKKQLGKWPDSVLQKIDLVFPDAPLPCQGKSDVEGIFDPPYYEWFQFNKVWCFSLIFIFIFFNFSSFLFTCLLCIEFR